MVVQTSLLIQYCIYGSEIIDSSSLFQLGNQVRDKLNPPAVSFVSGELVLYTRGIMKLDVSSLRAIDGGTRHFLADPAKPGLFYKHRHDSFI